MTSRVPTPPRAKMAAAPPPPPPPPPDVELWYCCGVCGGRVETTPTLTEAGRSRWYCGEGHRYRASFGAVLRIGPLRFRVQPLELERISELVAGVRSPFALLFIVRDLGLELVQ